MALKFNRLEPVIIDNKECTPEPTAEARRRLQMAHIEADGNRVEIAEAIAKCFPKDYDHVLEAAKTFMTETDLGLLQAYILDGERGIRRVMDMSDKLADKQIDKIIEAGK